MNLNIDERVSKIQERQIAIRELKREINSLRDLDDCKDKSILYKIGDVINPSKNINNIICSAHFEKDMVIDNITLEDYYGAVYECTVLKKDGSKSLFTSKFYIETNGK